MAGIRKTPDHGTRARYLHRTEPCRCGACCQANAAYSAEYRKRQRRKRGDRIKCEVCHRTFPMSSYGGHLSGHTKRGERVNVNVNGAA